MRSASSGACCWPSKGLFFLIQNYIFVLMRVPHWNLGEAHKSPGDLFFLMQINFYFDAYGNIYFLIRFYFFLILHPWRWTSRGLREALNGLPPIFFARQKNRHFWNIRPSVRCEICFCCWFLCVKLLFWQSLLLVICRTCGFDVCSRIKTWRRPCVLQKTARSRNHRLPANRLRCVRNVSPWQHWRHQDIRVFREAQASSNMEVSIVMGVPPITWWFLLGKIPNKKWMMTGGTPIYGNTIWDMMTS